MVQHGLDDADVVRHQLVQQIIRAYEQFDREKEQREIG